MRLSVDSMLLTCTFILTATTVILTVVRAIIDWKMLMGSKEYWGSWKIRRKDVARDVLNSMTTRQLKRELKKRQKNKN